MKEFQDGIEATCHEIDSELIKLDDDQKFGHSKIDPTLLTSRLIPEKDSNENDDVWTMHSSYTFNLSSKSYQTQQIYFCS